ncbi:hypothetical protein PF002_g8646 [Phytophthora fragariae]|uniref:Distal membrane-arm assembly complex protein 1-like domain-containing protein n=2 Tax=Phytophthora fragariae TaxID=53985 RepID=A0A6A3ZWS2_9STRA|nr:hypothetical protein PF003_g28712 [Phytophthora fragariae]KAE9242633.1 hypothetical protein PF002_g8646 [Phytophthora fragariae]KAE9283351.1 hypothetical protein PF001_g22894 [Phytophthora fragariae]
MTSEASEMEDCLGCRLTGSATLLGVGAYFLNERSKLPRHDLGQRRWLLACAGTFTAAGVWRATTHLFETPKESPATAADAAGNSTGTAKSWFNCEDCGHKFRAWIGQRDKQEQDRADDK